MKKLLHIIEKVFGVYRWHPKIALRYLPIVEQIQSNDSIQSILEVGSGGLGIVPYLRRQVVGVDLTFAPPIHKQLVAVYGSATEIPFAHSSFDVVISVDMLEHMDEKMRIQAIDEMLRVGKLLICIGVPCGELAARQDVFLAKKYAILNHKEFGYLNEHLTYGLPTRNWILETIGRLAHKQGKKIMIFDEGNINMTLRKWLMIGWLSKNMLINLFFRKILLLFVPVLRLWNQEPTYRRLFFITIQHD